MADEDGVAQAELAADLDQVVGIPRQRGVFGRIIGRQVRSAGADMVEEHGPEIESSKAGATNRHMFWSQPKPCAKTMASGPRPRTCTQLRVVAVMACPGASACMIAPATRRLRRPAGIVRLNPATTEYPLGGPRWQAGYEFKRSYNLARNSTRLLMW